MSKVGIVGTGMVGSTTAYSLLHSGAASRMVLVDANRRRAEGEAMDLGHAMPFNRPCQIDVGDYADLAGSEVVVISAGAAQKPGESRLDLVGRNAAIFREIIPRIVAAAPHAVLVVASNPVDIMTLAALRYSGLPDGRVIGSGTILDTARFRYLLGRHFGVDSRSVHAFIIGEHGDTEVPVWSGADIAGIHLADFAERIGARYDQAAMNALFEDVRKAAYHIIERKGSTYYAIGSGLVRIVEAVLRNQHTVYSLSTRLTGQNGVTDVCLSLPTIIGRSGVKHVIPLDLDEREAAGFKRSAQVLGELAAKAL